MGDQIKRITDELIIQDAQAAAMEGKPRECPLQCESWAKVWLDAYDGMVTA